MCRDSCHGCGNGAGGVEVEEAHVAYGGVAPKCIMAPRVQQALKGQPWTQATLDAALKACAEDVNIHPDAPGRCLAMVYTAAVFMRHLFTQQ